MSGESVMITVETATGAHTSFPVVLKKIMEMPPPNILACDDGMSSIDVASSITKAVIALDNKTLNNGATAKNSI